VLLRITIFLVFVFAASVACDLRSGTAKKEMERFDTPPPAPLPLPSAAASPVDPADVVEVDTSTEGEIVGVNGYSENKSVSCNKFDRVMVNGGRNSLTVKGPCRRIMVNGDDNRISADAVMDIVFNGSGNSVTYSRAVNGKRPTVTQNQQGNTVEQISKRNNIK
jgi:hypothetical protein